MTGREYQELAKVTQNLTLDKTQQLLNGCCGLAGESGEVIDIVKKHAFQGHDLDTEHIKEELGDVMWYIALLCSAIGADLSEVMSENTEKLKRRYPQGFDTNKSVNREVDNSEHKRNYIYIVDNNADPEFTIGTISVDAVFAKYEKAVEYIEKQGFEHLQDDIYVCEPYGQCVEIKMYEVQE